MRVRELIRRISRALGALLFVMLARPTGAQLLVPEFQVNTQTTNAQLQPGVASDGSGNFVGVWSSEGQDGSGFGVFGQRFDSQARLREASFRLIPTHRQSVAAGGGGGRHGRLRRGLG